MAATAVGALLPGLVGSGELDEQVEILSDIHVLEKLDVFFDLAIFGREDGIACIHRISRAALCAALLVGSHRKGARDPGQRNA